MVKLKPKKNFKGLWPGGYVGRESKPHPLNKNSTGHQIYKRCIKPYVNKDTAVLEIGVGRGVWTKCFLNEKAKKIICTDVLSAKYNNFWGYIGKHKNIEYHQVKDFSLSCCENESLDYIFSFGTFCHLDLEEIAAYFESMYVKAKNDANCFVMVTDMDKTIAAGYDPRPNRKMWNFHGLDNVCKILKDIGFKIMCKDVGAYDKDPIIHFKKIEV